MEAKAKEREALVSSAHGKDALNHAIAAAELYMKAAQAASSPEEKTRLTKKCQSLISKAEELKKSSQPGGGSVASVEKRLRLPRQPRQIPKSEQAILLRNSRLHGNVFPPWESEPEPKEFTGSPFNDTAEFSLSSRQRAVFAGWKRPIEIVGRGTQPDQPDHSLMEAQNDYDLVQDITTDCSVVASLCACMRHLRPAPTSILPALMFPINSENGQPKLSASGKYVFRMFFNGCFRKVVIDDRLPSSATDRTLYVVDRQNPRLIWPALMEKAYLKVRGGYDFPGSNSGTDLCALTGWIPQQLFLQSDDLDWERTWNRVKKAYDYGDVVVTLGTGRLSPDEEEILGLAGEHDYAVLDMSETTPGNRRLLVKNPWCDGLVWKGVGSSEVSSSRATEDHPIKLKPGSFWISFDDVTQNFESLYLNWNPSLFTERQDHHFSWQISDAAMAGGSCFARNPQYSMTASADGSTWILLSRHFQDDELNIMRNHRAATTHTTFHAEDPITNPNTTLAEVSSKLGFMSIYIFDDHSGQRVSLSTRPIYRGDFVDSPQTLAPFESKRGVTYTVVVATQELPLPKYSFTLSFFSRSPLAITPAPEPLRHYTEIKGSWTRRTAGGNSDSASYLSNPQFSLSLPRAGPLSLLLSTGRDDVPVHVALVWAAGRRVASVGNRDLALASGDYRRGSALAEAASVDAGTYTVVCSTFEPECYADFALRVGSDSPCVVAPVPADAAGRLRTRLPDLPTCLPPLGSGGGIGAGSEPHKKKRAAVSAARLSRACVVVTRSSSSYTPTGSRGGTGTNTPRPHPAVRATVEFGTGPDRLVLASTDGSLSNNAPEFREVGPNGLRTGEFDIDPRAGGRGLWLVVELLGLYHAPTPMFTSSSSSGNGGGGGDGLQVEILSESPVNVGAWEGVDD
ncbi:cysteine proteinase [Annulohypoxylon bovei var. microspora]|nr:cysteine proteinase [Annulohypoxylon bovei var. microspora]